MDVLSLDLTRSAPLAGGPGGSSPLATWRDRWTRRLERARSAGSGSPAPGAAAAARRSRLLAFTAAQIGVGLALLAWATATVPMAADIDPGLPDTALAGPTGGVLLWTVFGLLGSVRSVSNRGGQIHFTFNLPFVGAAMVLGGPTAGAWVAFLSTIERRELQSLPWYAIAANHATTVIAAVAGGAMFALAEGVLLGVTGNHDTALFLAVMLGGITLELVANILAAGTVMLRDEMTRRHVLAMLVEDFGRVTILEIGLIWVLAISFMTVGWWAPIVVGAVVLLAVDESPKESRDRLTGLLDKEGFERRLERKIGWMRRGILDGGTVMFLDLNGFHLVNNQHGHDVGDEVLRVVAARIAEACPRNEDLVSRLMGDEFGLFFAGLVAPEVAMRKAEQLVESVCRPVPTSVGPVHVGVAVGIHVTRAWGGVPAGPTLLRWAEQAMYIAKRESGPCGGAHLHQPDEQSPFDADWLESQR